MNLQVKNWFGRWGGWIALALGALAIGLVLLWPKKLSGTSLGPDGRNLPIDLKARLEAIERSRLGGDGSYLFEASRLPVPLGL